MKTLVRCGVLLVICIGLTACALGSGRADSTQVDVDGVSRVEFEGIGKLDIVQGSEETLSIEAEPEVLEQIEAQMRGDTLVIRLRSSFWRSGIVPTREIHYALMVRDLDKVSVTGAGDIQISGLQTDSLTVDLEGAGSIEIADLQAEMLMVEHSGAGNVTASGQVERQEIGVEGAGSYQAADLESQVTQISIEGAGEATLWVEQRLEARIAGLGGIRYYGDPTVEQQVSGLGQIKSLGAH